MAARNLEAVSRRLWDTVDKAGSPTDAEIQSGCQQRIADGIEAIQASLVIMTHDKANLISQVQEQKRTIDMVEKELAKTRLERDDLRRMVRIQKDGAKHLHRRISALKGAVTRAKRGR